jgi:hypothetical protein
MLECSRKLPMAAAMYNTTMLHVVSMEATVYQCRFVQLAMLLLTNQFLKLTTVFVTQSWTPNIAVLTVQTVLRYSATIGVSTQFLRSTVTFQKIGKELKGDTVASILEGVKIVQIQISRTFFVNWVWKCLAVSNRHFLLFCMWRKMTRKDDQVRRLGEHNLHNNNKGCWAISENHPESIIFVKKVKISHNYGDSTFTPSKCWCQGYQKVISFIRIMNNFGLLYLHRVRGCVRPLRIVPRKNICFDSRSYFQYSVVYFFCTILTPSKILATVSPFRWSAYRRERTA